jgi:hypothetical protein
VGYVPNSAEWYLAELVQELVVAGDPRNVIWRNLTLIYASSPDDAYEKALGLGRAGDSEYLNPAGKLVTTRFRGISFMDVVHDPLEHGAELLFHSETQVSEEQVAKLTCWSRCCIGRRCPRGRKPFRRPPSGEPFLKSQLFFKFPQPRESGPGKLQQSPFFRDTLSNGTGQLTCPRKTQPVKTGVLS